MADLWGKLDVLAVARQLSDLADAVVERCWSLASEAERFTGAGFVVLALGRLGGREMAYGSDVDLVFLYDPTVVSASHETVVKVAQRFLAVLSSPTREGVAYRVDTRLRPSGQVGPLVSTIEAFLRYQQDQARIWERQAILRARPVAGDRAVWRRVRPALRKLIFRQGDPAALATEVRAMREKMEKQIGPAGPAKYNLKAGRGGLVDVEFAAQYLQLAHGRTVPFLRSANTLVALERARREDRLAASELDPLRNGYRFLHHLENRLRIVADRPDEELEGDAAWESLARRTGRPGGGPALRDEFLRIREEVRGAFERVLRT
jgi:glutamate-ammonia-ligase adenylyltransferase